MTSSTMDADGSAAVARDVDAAGAAGAAGLPLTPAERREAARLDEVYEVPETAAIIVQHGFKKVPPSTRLRIRVATWSR